MSDIILLDRFFRKVHVHLVSCYGDMPRWPVLLGVFGRPGDGKSVQIDAALQQCNVEIIRINAADLESGLAGEPGKHIARTYSTASMAVAKQMPAALVIDDIDTTVGEWERNTGTVNHQQVLAELMHLADNPVDPIRNFPRRVPVFVTGNNLALLYPPLRRHGRMNTFNWRPAPGEIFAVVQGIFAGLADDRTLSALVSQFSDEPLSFFAAVRHEILQEEVARSVSQVGYDMRSFLHSGPGRAFHSEARAVCTEDILGVAKRVQSEHRSALTNFLADQVRDTETR